MPSSGNFERSRKSNEQLSKSIVHPTSLNIVLDILHRPTLNANYYTR